MANKVQKPSRERGLRGGGLVVSGLPHCNRNEKMRGISGRGLTKI